MRVTQSMLNNNMLRNLNNSMQGMDKYMKMLASGKKVNKPSDDPVAAVRSMFYRTSLIEIEQFQRNAMEGHNWMELTDQTMDSAVNVLQRARELLVRGASDSMAEASRHATAQEMRELKDQLGTLANASIGGRFIFSGTNTKAAPYDPKALAITDKDLQPIYKIAGIEDEEDPLAELLNRAGVANLEGLLEREALEEGDAGYDDQLERAVAAFKDMHGRYSRSAGTFTSDNKSEIRIEMGQGIFLPINVLGTNLFNDSNVPGNERKSVFRILDDIILTLEEGPPGELTGLIDDLDKNIDHIISSRASLGAKINRIELVQHRLADSEFSATKLLSDAEDADIPKVITNLKNQENVHQAALSTGARIIQPSLMDFLR